MADVDLVRACERGEIRAVQDLLRKCKDPLRVRSGYARETLLHIACSHGHLELVKILVEDHKCDVNAKDDVGRTPLHDACRDGHLEVVKILIEEHHCDVNAKDTDGDTPLHKACSRGHLEVVKILIEEHHCDVNVKSTSGFTPLHYSCGKGHLKVVKILIEEHHCDVNAKDTVGDTPLHYACWNGHIRIVRLLIENYHCDPSITDNRGWTPLHWACQSRHIRIVRLLIENYHCDPSITTLGGNTPLHYACQNGHIRIVQLLIENYHCDPSITNNDEWTPLHVACMRYHHETAKFLMKHMDPSWTDKNGETLLHFACRCGYNDAISDLLKEGKIDPDCTGRDGSTPLSLTNSSHVIRELLRHGATADYELWKKHGPSKEQPAIKAFIMGDPGTGKSTLTKALETESKGLSSLTNRVLKVSDVDQKTAGIVPHDIENKEFGRLTLYDFAGQKEFYAGHDAVLRSAVSGSSAAIFLIVADLRTSDNKFTERIQYWLNLLEIQGVSADPKPHIFVVASHADQVTAKRELEGKRYVVEALQKGKAFASFHYVGFVALNCQYAMSSSMSQLRQYLAESCEKLRNTNCVLKIKMSFRSHCFLVYLLDKFRDCPAVRVRDVSTRVAKDSPLLGSLPFRIPEDVSRISQLCDELSEKGSILFFKSAQNIESSWIVLNREALLSRVTGTVFAPKGFKQYCDLATSTGVVHFSKIQTHFPDLDTNMIIQFLCHLEYCHEVDSETLQLIRSSEGSDSAAISFDPTERFFFFPGLVSIDVPSGVWENSPNSPNFNYLCGWMLQCSKPGQFFTPRFLQVLLLRLAFSLALAPHDQTTSTKVPALQRNCQVWKNGICWGDKSGVEALVEVEEDKSVVVMLRCLKGSEVQCARIQSIVIGKIQEMRKTFCPKVTVSEYLIHHSDSKQYPPKCKLALVNVEDIATAVVEKNPSIVKPGKVIPLREILGFEPYTPPGVNILQQLFGDQNSTNSKSVSSADRPTLPQLLNFTEEKVNIPIEIGIKYVQFGALILQDKNGTRVNNMEYEYQRNVERINTKILQEWLDGKGKQPVSWATLIGVLRDIELSTLADAISACHPTSNC